MDQAFINKMKEAHSFVEKAKKLAKQVYYSQENYTQRCRNGKEYFDWLRENGVNIYLNDAPYYDSGINFVQYILNSKFDYILGELTSLENARNFIGELETNKYDVINVIAHSDTMYNDIPPDSIYAGTFTNGDSILILKSYLNKQANLITCYEGDTRMRFPELLNYEYFWRVSYSSPCIFDTCEKYISFTMPEVYASIQQNRG